MRKSIRVALTSVMAFGSFGVASAAGAPSASSKPRPWTNETSVKVRYFSSNPVLSSFFAPPYSGDFKLPAWNSPDGKYTFTLTHAGDFGCDCTVYTLSVFSAEQLRSALAGSRNISGISPLRKVEVGSKAVWAYGSTFGGILNVRWTDPTHIEFKTVTDVDSQAINNLDVESGKLETWRLPKGFSTDWAATANGSALILAGGLKQRATSQAVVSNTEAAYPVQPIRNRTYEYFQGNAYSVTFSIFSGKSGSAQKPIFSFNVPRDVFRLGDPAIAKNGKLGIFMKPGYETDDAHYKTVYPGEWKAYPGFDHAPKLTSIDDYDDHGSRGLWSGIHSRFWVPVIADLDTGEVHVALNTPQGPDSDLISETLPSYVWDPDSQHVLLVNRYLPVENGASAADARAYVVDYDAVNRRWSAVAPMVERRSDKREFGLQSVSPLGAGKVRLEYASSGEKYFKTMFRGTGAWTEVADETGSDKEPAKRSDIPLQEGIKLVLREAADVPPQLYVTDGKRERNLFPPDPALQGVRFISPQVVKWPEWDGHVKTGGLYLPPGHDLAKPGRPLPLVIQMSRDWDKDMKGAFAPDGIATTHFATQSLAANGFAVLEMDSDLDDYPALKAAFSASRKDRSKPGWQFEVAKISQRVDAAIEELARQGIIDPARVGLIGFSRTGYYTNYIITHPGKYRLAAAIVADSTTESYYEYVAAGAKGDSESLYGGSFWENPKTWLEQAPAFNVQHVQTPVLFSYTSFYQQQIDETRTAFKRNGKPFDMMFYPNGGHQLQLPRQRLAAMDATIDWMNFWLMGREDNSPTKAGQYNYWRLLHEMQNSQKAK